MAGKTNSEWYPYETFGGFFKLEDGVLFECPMDIDGSRDDNPYEVDFNFGLDEEDKPRLRKIVHELEKKP